MHERKYHQHSLLVLVALFVLVAAFSAPFALAQETTPEAKDCSRLGENFDINDVRHKTGLVCFDCHAFHQGKTAQLLDSNYDPDAAEEQQEKELADDLLLEFEQTGDELNDGSDGDLIKDGLDSGSDDGTKEEPEVEQVDDSGLSQEQVLE
jgi:hypothetical protein